MSDRQWRDSVGPTSAGGSMTFTRTLCVVLIALFAGLYTAGVLTGTVEPDRQLNATHLALLAVSGAAGGLLLGPDALRRVTSLSAAGVSIEIEKIQQQVSETKREAEETLQLLAEIFPLLLPNNVFQHLKNLAPPHGRSTGEHMR